MTQNNSALVIDKQIFTCEKCDYNTKVKCNYEKHLLSQRHLGTKKEKQERYICEKCQFNSPNMSNYKVHLQSPKHQFLCNGIKKEERKSKSFGYH